MEMRHQAGFVGHLCFALAIVALLAACVAVAPPRPEPDGQGTPAAAGPAAPPQTGAAEPSTGGAAAIGGPPRRGGEFVDSSFREAKTMQPLLNADTASDAYISLH